MKQGSKDRLIAGVVFLAAAYPFNFLHILLAQEPEVLKPFLLRPEFRIDNGWYYRFLGFFLSMLLVKIGACFLIEKKEWLIRLVAKAVATVGVLEVLLYLVNFNQLPCEWALGLYGLTLLMVVLYAAGMLARIGKTLHKYFPEVLVEDSELNQISHH